MSARQLAVVLVVAIVAAIGWRMLTEAARVQSLPELVPPAPRAVEAESLALAPVGAREPAEPVEQ